jgi:hypothetical protein
MTPEEYDIQVDRIHEEAKRHDLPYEAIEAAIVDLNELYADENSQEFQDRGEAAAHVQRELMELGYYNQRH